MQNYTNFSKFTNVGPLFYIFLNRPLLALTSDMIMYRCEFVGSKILKELVERFIDYDIEFKPIQDLTIARIGKASMENNEKIFHVLYVAIPQPIGESNNPIMDCFRLSLKGKSEFIWHQVGFLVSQVKNARKNGQNVADIIFV